MTSYYLAGVFAITLIALSVLRSRSVTIKVIGEALLLALIAGCLVWAGTGPLPTHLSSMHESEAAWLRALAAVWWLIGARLVATVSILALGRDARSRKAKLVSDLLAGGVYVTAVLIILNSVLDLKVNGLLATSGVLAIVLGLALQNTLADVFSGVAVGIEQPFHIGDRVSIGDHPEGVIVQMNWRAVRLQTDSEDLATIPNSIVARSEIVNRSVPTERRAATVEIPTQSAARSETLMALIQQAVLLSPAILEEPGRISCHKAYRRPNHDAGCVLFRGDDGRTFDSKRTVAAPGPALVPSRKTCTMARLKHSLVCFPALFCSSL